MNEVRAPGSGLYRDTRNTGPQTRARFEYQDACVALRCIANLRTGSPVTGVVLEWATDYLLLAADGGRELVSVKHRDPGLGDWSYAGLRKEQVLRDLHAVWKAMGETGDYVFESNRGFSRTATPYVIDQDHPQAAPEDVGRLARDLGIDVKEASRFVDHLRLRRDPLPDRRYIDDVAIRNLHELMLQLGLDPARAEDAYAAIVSRIAAASTQRPPSPADRIQRLVGLMRDVAARTGPDIARSYLAINELRQLVIEVSTRQPRPSAPSFDQEAESASVDRIANALADEVHAHCSDEASKLWLRRPAPIQVRWSRSTGTTAVASGLPASGTVGEIGALYRGLPSRQLVIKGAAGGGKTATTILLALSMLEAGEKDGSVPVLLEASSWNPRAEHLTEFVVRRLVEDFGAITGNSSAAMARLRQMVISGRLVPILDGLDELPADLFPLAIEHLDQLSSEGQPMVITWRSREYGRATERAGFVLSRAAVIELEPLTIEESISFLARSDLDAKRWAPVFDHLAQSPNGILARVLSFPMMTGLARITYAPTGTNPRELAELSSLDAVTGRVIDVFVSTTYRNDRPHASSAGSMRLIDYDPLRARRWLGYIACHLQEMGTINLTWHQFAKAPNKLFLAGFGVGAVVGTLVAFALSAITEVRIGAGVGLTAFWLIFLWMYSSRSIDSYRPDILARRRSEQEARARVKMEGRSVDIWTYRLSAPLTRISLLFGRASGTARAWLWFRMTHAGLAMRGQLPWRFARFLRDAHRRGVLRKSGAALQFRHALIREHLAKEVLVDRLQRRSDSGDDFATVWLAHLWTTQGATERALNLLRRHAENGSKIATVRFTDLLAEQRSIPQLRQQADAGNIRAAVRLAHLLFEDGDAEQAMETVRPYADDAWWATDCLAAAHVRQGEIAEAVALLTRRAEAGNLWARLRLDELQGPANDRYASPRQHDDVPDSTLLVRYFQLRRQLQLGELEQVQGLAAAGDSEATHALADWLQEHGKRAEVIALLRRSVEDGQGWWLDKLVDLVGKDDAEQALGLWHRHGQSFSFPRTLLWLLVQQGHIDLAIGVLHRQADRGDRYVANDLVDLLATQAGLRPLPSIYSRLIPRFLPEPLMTNLV